MLIVNANTPEHTHIALRTDGEHIVTLAPDLAPEPGEVVFDAGGGAVLPGLHDHHLHLLAYAAGIGSVQCGPPRLDCAQALAETLAKQAAHSEGWIRGIGYHESVAGEIDRCWLDRVVPGRPIRIQHRSGQLWIFNSLGLRCLGVDEVGAGDPFERVEGKPTGRLYGADAWVRERLGASMPALGEASRRLARFGITGVTDASPGNGLAEFRHFAAEREAGRLQQNVLMMGSEALDPSWVVPGLSVGATKIHLREAALPLFDTLCERIERSHRAGRPVAVHCVTLVELMLAVSALQATGVQAGDRLEHAAVASEEAVDLVREAGLHVVTQPNFIFERGDSYLASLSAEELEGLYRAGSFAAARVPVGAGSDAPYGDPDPWRAMAAALDRRTRVGCVLGRAERLAPASVLDLYCSDPLRPGGARRRLAAGGVADLCVLDRPLEQVFADAAAVKVRLTVSGGRIIHST